MGEGNRNDWWGAFPQQDSHSTGFLRGNDFLRIARHTTMLKCKQKLDFLNC